MFVNIFNYVDRLMNLIRPNKVLYLAVDGVAPEQK
jgi:5'-3' exoribonuclease 2